MRVGLREEREREGERESGGEREREREREREEEEGGEGGREAESAGMRDYCKSFDLSIRPVKLPCMTSSLTKK